MQPIDRIRAEAEAIQLMKAHQGFDVIMSELSRRIANVKPVDISDPLWFQKSAQADGRLLGLREFQSWIIGRVNLDAANLDGTSSPPEA